VLSNPKFNDYATQFKIDIGEMMLTAQKTIQQLNTINEQMVKDLEVAKQQVIQAQAVTKVVKQPPIPNNVKQPSKDVINKPFVPIAFPNNLKIDKKSERSVIVTWDPPTIPLPSDQQLEGNVANLPINVDQTVPVVILNYNIYLNHELYAVVGGTSERLTTIEDVDMQIVSDFIFLLFVFSLLKRFFLFNLKVK
jgi:hypothetical protein